MSYKLSQRSLDKLGECHIDLQTLMKESIGNSPYDFGITWGHRSPVKQNELYQKGRDASGSIINKGDIVTYVDGFIKKSKHNYMPALAVDILVYINNKHTWEPKFYLEVGTYIMEIAEDLFEQEKIVNRIVWGGTWHKFKDWCHFQI